jgi:hypothetical protein
MIMFAVQSALLGVAVLLPEYGCFSCHLLILFYLCYIHPYINYTLTLLKNQLLSSGNITICLNQSIFSEMEVKSFIILCQKREFHFAMDPQEWSPFGLAETRI